MRPDVLPPNATELIGGPIGRHAAGSGWWRAVAVRLIALVSIPMAIAVVQREHCIRFGWVGQDQFWRECFSDLPAQYALGNLHTGLIGYLDGSAAVDQPVLAGSVMSLFGGLVPNPANALDGSRWYFLYWVAFITLLLAVTVWCTALLVPGDLQAAAQVALSPVIVTAAVLSSDALAVALVAAAMLAWHRRAYVLCGVLLGAGTMTRSYVAVVAIALALHAWRSETLEPARRVAVGVFGTLAGLALFFGIVRPDALTAPYTSWWSSKASYGSPWLLPATGGHELPVWSVTTLAILGFGAAVTMGWIFTRDAYRTPTWAQVALVVVAMTMMTGKAVPVQAALWLLPLAAAAGVRWRDQLIWASCEFAHFVAIWLYVGALTRPDRALPAPWYAVFLVVRLAGITWLVSRVWFAAQSPVVRRVIVPAEETEELAAQPSGAGDTAAPPSAPVPERIQPPAPRPSGTIDLEGSRSGLATTLRRWLGSDSK